MLYPVDVTYTLVGGGGGNVSTGTGLFYDTDTKALVQTSVSRQQSLLDPKPADVHLWKDTLLDFTCAADFTKTNYFYDGAGGLYQTTETDSVDCGWTAPLTCDLGAASVSQVATATGATLTFRYAGTTNGQPRYTLDGGAEQTSPSFLNVAVGKHTLAVRDDGLAGCTRSVDVEVLPLVVAPVLPAAPTGPSQGVDFVGQPLWYPLSGQPVGALVELELWAESAHGRDDFALVLPLRKRVDAQGLVSFRLDALLWPLLSAFVPASAVATSLCTTNLVNYYVRTTTTPLLGGGVVHAISPLRTALRGGLPAEWQATDYFRWRNLAFAYPPFLSWQPLGAGPYAAGQAKPIVASQPEWLFFLCPLGLTNTELRIRRSYPAAGLALADVDYEPLARPAGRGWAQRLLAIPLVPGRAGAASMRVRVETAAGDAVSPEASYVFVEASPRTRFLLFTNSLGGVDTLRCEGRLEASLDAVASSVERPAQLGAIAPAADRQLAELAASRKLKLATGWLTPAEIAWAQEVVLSRELWLATGAQLRPLDAAKRTLATYSDEPTLRGLLLEFDYAFAPTAYAPPYA